MSFQNCGIDEIKLKHTIEQVGFRNSWKHFSVLYALEETHAFGVFWTITTSVFKIMASMKLDLKHIIERIGLRNSWKCFFSALCSRASLRFWSFFQHFYLSFQNCGIDQLNWDWTETEWAEKSWKHFVGALCSRANVSFWSFFQHYDLNFENFGSD
jgi:hypothetical protein